MSPPTPLDAFVTSTTVSLPGLRPSIAGSFAANGGCTGQRTALRAWWWERGAPALR